MQERAVIHDFKMANLLTDDDPNDDLFCRGPGSRWMAPELTTRISFYGMDPTVETDVWYVGMIIVEILGGERPFTTRRTDQDVWAGIAAGVLPERPKIEDCNWAIDGVWQVVDDCLAREPEDRIGVKEIESRLREQPDIWEHVPKTPRRRMMI